MQQQQEPPSAWTPEQGAGDAKDQRDGKLGAKDAPGTGKTKSKKPKAPFKLRALFGFGHPGPKARFGFKDSGPILADARGSSMILKPTG